jgi:hypothetical protein
MFAYSQNFPIELIFIVDIFEHDMPFTLRHELPILLFDDDPLLLTGQSIDMDGL